MLRYLRARKFIPKDAFAQFKDTEDWRKENQLDTLYETIDVNEYEQTRRLYPQWTGRRDKRGIPIYVFEVAGIDYKDVAAYEQDADRKKKGKGKGDKIDIKAKVPRKMLRLFALYENLCRFVLPLCSAVPNRPNAETPVSQSGNIVDLSKVGIKQFWNLKSHLQDSSSLATAHYPETLDHIFVVGAPAFFSTIWDWAKRWFDPITVQKITIINDKTMLQELSKFIDPDNIPKKYGGNLEWKFGDRPFLEPEIANSLRWKQDVQEHGHRTFPIGPIKWEYDEDGDLVATAIGSEAGAPRKQVLAGLHPENVATLALSPGRNPLTRHHSALFATVSHTGATTAVNEKEKTELANGTAHKMALNNENINPQTTEASALPVEADSIHDAGKTDGSAVPDSSRVGTYTVPYRDPTNEIAHPPEDARQGTSHTRYTQQAGTHAEGQLADGTPHVREDGQGTAHTVMEPRTVGQAPKDTPITREEEPQPTIIDTAKEYAGQAQAAVTSGANAVLGAVGLGEKKVEEPQPEPVKKEDSRIDNLDQAQVEELLREKHQSLGDQTKT